MTTLHAGRWLEESSSSSSVLSYFFGNMTNATEFGENLTRPEDVSVDAVLSAILFNGIVCLALLSFYELLRRILPTVYSSRKRLDRVRRTKEEEFFTDYEEFNSDNDDISMNSSLSSLPEDRPFAWIGPLFGVPWSKVRRIAGLDGYFFLRFIRMNVRICAVSSFWFFLILVPIYGTGTNQEFSQHGWYHISTANIPAHGWRMWIACVFAYLFAAFVIFVIKQEYRHFLEIRQDFLARGTPHVNPQHHYAIMVENIPDELRSDKALMDYFQHLFPARVHSASVVLNLPDLEEASLKCTRSCRRLEKSIAYLHATEKRHSHIVGRGRISVLGVDLAPCDCKVSCNPNREVVYVEDGRYTERPEKGTRVDSISYYTQELAAHRRKLYKMQARKTQIAESGNIAINADNWFDRAVSNFADVADTILIDSAMANDLLAPEDPSLETPEYSVKKAEKMRSVYGSFGVMNVDDTAYFEDKRTNLISGTHLDKEPKDREDRQFTAPFSSESYHTNLRRTVGRLGLDFVVAGIKEMHKQLDFALEGVIGATMSSTGFVTFGDLSSLTCAASAPLTVKPSALLCQIAPEPREIVWQNAHVSRNTMVKRERIANVFFVLGVILWSFPLAAIQAFAKAKYLAQIPGMEWIETFHAGALTSFVNGYLPVVALLGLILILPVIFEYVALKYERRKTVSDIQASMVGRYFYYQLATVYVSVTAGSILTALGKAIDHPSSVLELLGESFPTMVGYFVALLVTKIMAGLPMIFLRFGALSRMVFLKTLSNEKKLTQRELDAVYRLENVQYGWEFPTQLLVVVIVFTYAIICPVILPFGLVYFFGALIVYKKQVLYVYSPVYESGGSLFPIAVQRSLFGLVCSQLTLIGYLVTRGCYYQPIFLIPLPLLTVAAMRYFSINFVEPSKRLSLERAREYDKIVEAEAKAGFGLQTQVMDDGAESKAGKLKFDKNAFRQPVLTEVASEPRFYRRGVEDEETVSARTQLNTISRRFAVEGSDSLS